MEKKLKILSVNTSDVSGGAARAAFRIHKAVNKLNVNSQLFVKNKLSKEDSVISLLEFVPKNFFNSAFLYLQYKLKNKIQHYQWAKYQNKENVFLSDLRSVRLYGALKKLDYDILHLHWINLRFFNIKKLRKINKPIVWTLHDSWAFTGVCHFFYNCDNYKDSCGKCPFLNSDNPNDISHSIWLKKEKAYQSLNLHIVTPSKWLESCVKNSSLLKKFDVSVIPNCLDTDIYKPLSKPEACDYWKLDPTKKKILFGAMNAIKDKNKGFDYLLAAISFLEKYTACNSLELVIFGSDKPMQEIKTLIPIHYLGCLLDEMEIVTAYNASDVMVVPSLSEVFGQTASESMACGIPVVAFNCSGIKEVVDHKITGYLADPYSAENLAEGIIWCLENNKNNTLSINARKKVLENYSMSKVGELYRDLYMKLI